MVAARLLRASHVAARVGYRAIGARVIRRVAVTSVTTAFLGGLTWLGLYVVVVGSMFGGVGCHATSKGAELSCDLDCAIPF